MYSYFIENYNEQEEVAAAQIYRSIELNKYLYYRK